LLAEGLVFRGGDREKGEEKEKLKKKKKEKKGANHWARYRL